MMSFQDGHDLVERLVLTPVGEFLCRCEKAALTLPRGERIHKNYVVRKPSACSKRAGRYSRAMEARGYQRVQLDFSGPAIRPRMAISNHSMGRLRDECLNTEVFFTLSDIKEKLESWRQDYNQVRPHSTLRDSAPAEFAARWQTTAATAPTFPVPAKKAAAGQLMESII
jgi:hypothetical protein